MVQIKKFGKHPLNVYFDKIYVINLVNRTDRRDAIKRRLELLGIEVEFFDAVRYNFLNKILDYINLNDTVIDGKRFKNSNEIGCALSHLSIIQRAKDYGLKNVLIFEDDTVFLKNFNDIIEKYLELLPVDYNMAYLSCNTWKINSKTSWVVRGFWRNAHDSYAACAYAVNSNFYDSIINYTKEDFRIIDNVYRRLQRNADNKIYMAIPNLTAQDNSFSDLAQLTTNYYHDRIINYAGKVPSDYF